MSMYSNYMYDSVGEWLENKYTVGNSKSLKVIQLNMRGMNDVSKFDWIGENAGRCSCVVRNLGES